MNFRAKPIGWRYESQRHSLAAKGVSSSLLKQKTSFSGVKTRLSVPPAWRDVHYYSDKPYVATGVDKKGRLQYIYSPSFIKKTSEKKYARIDRLEQQIPGIMEKVKRDVDKGVPEAEAIYTIYKTGFRPGSEKDTLAEEQAYGVSTLESKHVKVKGSEVQFKFIGKKGVAIEKDVKDKILADIIKSRKGEKNKQLFPVTDSQMRSYFERVTNGRYQLKDLRTLRAQTLAKKLDGDKKVIAQKVSAELGNTPAVAIKSYVSPDLIEGV